MIRLIWKPVIRESDYIWRSTDGKIRAEIQAAVTCWIWYIYKEGYLISTGRGIDSATAKTIVETWLAEYGSTYGIDVKSE